MSSKKMRPTRYAHYEGHTDICYTDDGKYIITCGTDGEVRVFEGLDDDDCKTHLVAESAHAIAYKDGRFLVATDSNLVQAFTMDEGTPDGIITRFTAPATHIVVSKDNKLVVCAGSDMLIKVHNAVAYKDTILTGHQAPVLSVAIDPKGEYVASSSCDGSVRVWMQKLLPVIASWAILPKTNNVSTSRTLCRLSWSKDGRFLCVPIDQEIRFYERDSWEIKHRLTDSSIKQTISVVAVSKCGKFIAGACMDGVIVIWNMFNQQTILSEQHPKSLPISGLAWNPSEKKEVGFVNVDGQLGTIENFDDAHAIPEDNDGAHQNGMVNGMSNGEDFPPLDVDMNEVDDEDEFSISKIKSKLGFADDEEGTYIGLSAEDNLDIASKAKEDETSSVISKTEPTPAPVFQLPEVQKPFQPGMSPEFLNDRYMVWNNVGIVRQYSSEDENSIDVEFHDTSVHHALHLNNNAGHTMATLSNEALALACESQEDQPSKLVVQNFAPFGNSSKEWHVDMPAEEEIVAICIGTGWLAAATDKRNLRVFSTSGIQRDIINIPGEVVCLAAAEDQLMFIYHTGMGASGDQSMAAAVLHMNGGKHLAPMSCHIPLSPRSFLAWAGFSDEGTPVIMDSAGMVHIMHLKYGLNWTSILNTKNHTRGKSDHYFVVGVSETQSNVRCILCKGSRYPPVLPKPHVSLLSMQVPICELETEKGGLEEKMIRTSLQLNTFDRLNGLGFEVDQSKNEAEKILKEAMIKLFALACRTERESRAVEICQLMPSYHTVQLAIKYAGKLHRLQLAERLGEVASAKMEEEIEKESRERNRIADDFHLYGGGGGGGMRRYQQQVSDEEEEEEETKTPQEEGSEEQETCDNPLLAAAVRKEVSTPKASLLISPSTKNPFKKNTPGSQSNKRGIDIIDQFRKAQKKEHTPVLRPLVKKPQSKQTTLKKKLVEDDAKTPSGKENKSENLQESTSPVKSINPFKKSEDATPQPVKPNLTSEIHVKKKSALQLWLADNEEEVKLKFPEAAEGELLAKAALVFKDVDNDVKQKYKSMAATSSTPIPTTPSESTSSNEAKKRKVDESDSQDSPVDKKPKGSGVQKLAAFAFNKS
ncbi:WD repeat and HMG-box DNA-binding protein 1 [Palaemon carinicauda]|uniref:WD repeat and HMG-box DNA-binding protein 1 n=1 Tax=Palaemon carinicauda TaxID=392227 RepID=UPI0035B6130B